MLEEYGKRAAAVESLLARPDGQVVMNNQQSADAIMGDVAQLVEWNCQHVASPYRLVDEGKFVSGDELSSDPTEALLQFMVAATPNDELSAEMMQSPRDYLSKMTITPENSLVGDGRVSHKTLINNVPDTVNPVKARMAFVQVPDGDSTALELVWKVGYLG